jgi:hypothetical protein
VAHLGISQLMFYILEDFLKQNVHHKGIFLAGFTISCFAVDLYSILILCRPEWEFGQILFA